MKLSAKVRLLVALTLMIILVIIVGFVACRNKADHERFYAAYEQNVVSKETELVAKIKEKATSVLGENLADAFVEVGYLDNVPRITLHVLTTDLEYKTFKVRTEMDGPVVDLLSGGSSPYNEIARAFVLNAVAKLQDGVIYLREG